jgi:hypothetical protein
MTSCRVPPASRCVKARNLPTVAALDAPLSATKHHGVPPSNIAFSLFFHSFFALPAGDETTGVRHGELAHVDDKPSRDWSVELAEVVGCERSTIDR